MSNDIPHKTRVAVRNRSQGVCERCGFRPAKDMAHRIPRNTGGHAPSNIAHLCRPCHDWCHANPTKAYASGWIVRANSRVTPADMGDIPARSRDNWVLLLDDGGKRPIREAIAVELLTVFGIREVVA